MAMDMALEYLRGGYVVLEIDSDAQAEIAGFEG